METLKANQPIYILLHDNNGTQSFRLMTARHPINAQRAEQASDINHLNQLGGAHTIQVLKNYIAIIDFNFWKVADSEPFEDNFGNLFEEVVLENPNQA